MDSLEKLLEQKKQLEAKIRLAKNRLQREERKKDTRIKILLGAYVKSQPDLYERIIKSDEFNKYLIRENDRAVFNLDILDVKEPPVKTGGAKIAGSFEIQPDSDDL